MQHVILKVFEPIIRGLRTFQQRSIVMQKDSPPSRRLLAFKQTQGVYRDAVVV
jgi:hypothetical protein